MTSTDVKELSQTYVAAELHGDVDVETRIYGRLAGVQLSPIAQAPMSGSA